MSDAEQARRTGDRCWYRWSRPMEEGNRPSAASSWRCSVGSSQWRGCADESPRGGADGSASAGERPEVEDERHRLVGAMAAAVAATSAGARTEAAAGGLAQRAGARSRRRHGEVHRGRTRVWTWPRGSGVCVFVGSRCRCVVNVAGHLRRVIGGSSRASRVQGGRGDHGDGNYTCKRSVERGGCGAATVRHCGG